MAHTYHELKEKTIAELREIAKGVQHDAVKGYTQMNKEHLLPALCTALGIVPHEHHAAAGAVKVETRRRMRELREKREQAVASGDHGALKAIRREYHHLNRKLRESARKPAAT